MLLQLWRAMRPGQWVKNVFVLAALVFAHQLNDPAAVFRVLAAFGIFCALSSSVYLLNDIVDREADRHHPTKRHRPIAAGRLSVGTAGGAALVFAAIGLLAAWAVGRAFCGVACAYLLMNLAYSLSLKKLVIVDVMLVAGGFLLRAWAGALAARVDMSHWLILCTGLVALFLGFVKRRQELVAAGDSAESRASLRQYSLPFLDQMIAVVTSSTVMTYALYAFSGEVAEKLGTPYLGLTLPFVLYGIFRYLYLAYQEGQGESPAELVLSDRPFLINVLLWGGAVVLTLYLVP